MQFFCGILLILSLYLGPLCAGSYFGAWRHPLLGAISLVFVMSIITSFKAPKKQINLGLLALLVWLIIQGCWMWFNTWGVFIKSPIVEVGLPHWRILEIDNQPFPFFPGSADKAEALDRLLYIIPCLGIIWCVRMLVHQKPAWCYFFAKALFYSGVTMSILGLIQRSTGATSIFWMDELHFKNNLFFGTYRSPGIATCFLNVALVFGLTELLTIFRSRLGKAKLPLILLNFAGVLLILCSVTTAGSKAGMAIGIFTLLLWGILNRHSLLKAFHRSSELFSGNQNLERNIILTALFFISTISIISLSGLIYQRWMGAQEHGYNTLVSRASANETQIKMINDDEWGALGYGPGSFYPLFHYFKGDKKELQGTWVYAHNDYLQTLVEWGWLGFICFATIIGGGIALLAREVFFQSRHHSKTRFLYLRAYLIAMVFFLLHATVDFPFQIESLAVIFSVMLGVAWGVTGMRDQDIRHRKSRRSRVRS